MVKRAMSLVLVLLLVFSFCASPSLRASSDAPGKGSRAGPRSAPSTFIENGYLKAFASTGGRFVVGTTGGDPDSTQDDNKGLQFGYPNEIGTSFATLRILDGAQTSDYKLGSVDWKFTGDEIDIPPVTPPVTDTTSMTTVYEQDGVRVEERLYFTLNESTNRPDTTAIQYTLTNLAGNSRSIGLRMMLDIRAGGNDGAPYFVDGSGYVTRQAEWTSGNMPSFWVAYESSVYSSSGLKARGQLTGGTTVTPDRFVIADWDAAKITSWNYTVDPQDLVTNDSATILYYNPVTLAPGQSRTVRTYYGITRAGGVSMPQLEDFEVTQGVQDLNNSVPLIQNRPTYVRAHVRSTLGIIGGVTAELIGTRNGQPLPGSPLMPANSGGAIDAIENPDRQQLGQSFFFALPAEWLNGDVELELRGLNRTIGCNEHVGHPNDCKATVSFQPAYALDAHFYGFTWAQAGQMHQPTLSNITAAQRQIGSTFPVPQVNWIYAGNLDATYLGGPPSTQLDFINLNNMLEVYRILDGCISNGLQGCKTYYLGVLVDQPEAVGYAGMTAGTPPTFITTAYLSNGLFVPHELGAAMGQLHTLCRGDEDQPTQTYPYPNAMISYEMTGDNAFYGFDVNTRVIYPPYTRDMMSHCQPRWESDWTYQSIMAHLADVYGTPSAAPQAPALQAGESAVLVSGVITFTNDTGRFSATYILPAPGSISLPQPGDYTIRLEKSDGTVLASYPFIPHVSSDDHTYGSFNLLLPWNAEATRVVLVHGNQTLDTRGTSGHAPFVQLMYPRGGENLSGSSATVVWLGSDVDGDPLTYIVQYSRDGGATWQTLASGLTATTYNLDLTRLPGSNQAKIRVLASDGMYTAQDQSVAVFTVGRHSPQAQITQPANDSAFAGDQSLVLEGLGVDVEDGAVAGATLTWTSNRDGVLGTGATLVRSASTLQAGAHIITLQARDSDGQTGAATISVQVTRIQPPLPAHLSLAPTEMQFTAVAHGGQTDWQALSIHNAGDGDLNWSASTPAPWLLVTADSGAGPADILVAVNPGQLAAGNYQSMITFTSPEADNSPFQVTVRLAVSGVPPAPRHSLFLPMILSGR